MFSRRFFWSIATLCLGLSTGLVMLIILRMTVGLFEVPSFLINNRIATTWFGERERATCIAVYTSAEFVGANFVDHPALIILFLSLAFFANGLASIHWSLVSATAPERLIGLTSGVFNGIGGLAGITAPIIIGLLLRGGDFTRPLTFIACIALLGACSYIFVVGKLERVVG